MLKRRSGTDGCAEARLGDQLIPLAMVVLLRIMSSLRTTVTQEECVDTGIAPRNGFVVEVTFLMHQPDRGPEYSSMRIELRLLLVA